MHTSYLSLGSNLENKYLNLLNAIAAINIDCGKIAKVSSVYKTPPFGFSSENYFLNLCVELETPLSVRNLLTTLKNIEKTLGRKEKSVNRNYSDRIIDIDIIYYDNDIVSEIDLTIPHSEMSKRRFVLMPLCEIAPEKIHPCLKKSSAILLKNCADKSEISIFAENK